MLVKIINKDDQEINATVALPMSKEDLFEIQNKISDNGKHQVYYKHDLFAIEDIFDFNEVCQRKLS